MIGELSPSGSYIKELNSKKEKLEQKLTENSEYIITPISGIVSYRVDGLEEVLTPEDFSNLTEENLETIWNRWTSLEKPEEWFERSPYAGI